MSAAESPGLAPEGTHGLEDAERITNSCACHLRVIIVYLGEINAIGFCLKRKNLIITIGAIVYYSLNGVRRQTILDKASPDLRDTLA
ncbi:MAG: hypothetical protein QF897_06360, partial [Gammaproteobacteria bacterium]|nr:hypothetical protein [Gammaproteobacteria bacterium]